MGRIHIGDWLGGFGALGQMAFVLCLSFCATTVAQAAKLDPSMLTKIEAAHLRGGAGQAGA